MKTLKRNIFIFCVVTLTSGWIGVFIDNILTERPKGNSPGMLNFKEYLLAICIYPFVTAILIGIALVLFCLQKQKRKIYNDTAFCNFGSVLLDNWGITVH